MKKQAVHDLRETLCGRRPKTEAEDAGLSARLLYLREAFGQEYAFHVAHAGPLPYRNLHRWKQVQARRRGYNQRMQVLDVLFPGLRRVFRKSTTRPMRQSRPT